MSLSVFGFPASICGFTIVAIISHGILLETLNRIFYTQQVVKL